jgi:streptogramin lyase
VLVRMRKPSFVGIAVGTLVVLALLTAFFATQFVTKAAPASARLTRYTITTDTGSLVQGVTVDKQGNPWFAAGVGTIGTLDHHTGALRVYDLKDPNAGVGYIKFDSDGNIWFQECNDNAIGTINLTTGQERDFAIPTTGGQCPTFIQVDSHNNVWFNDVDFSTSNFVGDFVGRFDPSSGVMAVWEVPTLGARLEEIGVDGAGNFWFAEQGANKVGRLNPNTNVITEFTSPTPNSDPAGILIASDNTVWYSEHSTDKIAHLFPNKAHGVNTHVTPTEVRPGPTLGSNQFVAGAPTNPVSTVEPGTSTGSTVTTTAGIVEYSLPASGSSSNTEDMRFDPNGNIFFEDDSTAQIGELVLHGTNQPYINEWSIPNGTGYYNIEFGVGGVLWITDFNGGALYTFTLGN